MSIPRRNFLSWLGMSGAYAAAGGPLAAARPADVPLRPIDPKWDMSWTDRLTGKYRAVFDSPSIADGGAVFRAGLWREQHTAVYGTPASDLNAVVVVRHAGIPLAMDNAYWDEYEVGKALKLKDDAGHKWLKANPVGGGTGAAAQGGFAKYMLPNFLASGGIVLACNLAFGQIISNIRKHDKVSQDEATKRAHAHLIPGVILQPSGIFAVLRAEEMGCNYIMGS